MLHDTKGYIQALTDYRAGDAGPIIELFIDATQKAIINAEILAQDIETLRDEVLSIAQPKTPLLRSLTDLCCTEPDFTARMVEEHTQGFRASAYRLLNRMVELQILRHERDGADRCAIGHDNPRENSTAVGAFQGTKL